MKFKPDAEIGKISSFRSGNNYCVKGLYMSVKKGQELKLEISELAFGGKGIARKDGFTVFVDHTVPLDIVTARIIKKKEELCCCPCCRDS